MRRRALEFVGDYRHSQLAAPGLRDALEAVEPSREGFFVEAGAHDGLWQSNSYWLERTRGWSGVLVEPIPEMFARCQRNRRQAKVFNCALVGDDSVRSVPMVAAGLTSLVRGARGGGDAEEAHLQAGERYQQLSRHTVEVEGRTLTSVLLEARAPQIDLLSLDVEGFELQVLDGLDLDRFSPRFALIEALTAEDATRIEERLGATHELILRPTATDLLFRRR